MGVLSGTWTVRRYQVVGTVPDAFRDAYAEALAAHAFRPGSARRTDTEGWVSIRDLLDTDFAVHDTWLYDHYAVFALRVDRKVVPARLVRALLAREVAAWCTEHDRPRCPRPVREEMKERIEIDLLSRSLPRVQVYEISWDLAGGWLLFHHHGEAANARFRTLFHRTFGLSLQPWTPLDLLAESAPHLVDPLLATGGTQLGGTP
ncbi:MAG: recombination-associated protein RdgC [Deltaproteobacteria bacterium]|nr:recombination-associated protein RdgC [Deltaproteobacteria bacterium]